MSRKLTDIIAHIRSCCDNPSIKTTLIQTEDLRALCEAAEEPTGGLPRGTVTTASPFAMSCLQAKEGWRDQPFEYHAAHFLVGSGLVGGNLDGHIRGLADALKKQYDLGVRHGMAAEERAQPPVA